MKKFYGKLFPQSRKRQKFRTMGVSYEYKLSPAAGIFEKKVELFEILAEESDFGGAETQTYNFERL